MQIKLGHINLILAYGCLSFVIFLGGGIKGIIAYSTQGTIPVITEATIWIGLIGLFSAIATLIEICSNIEDPIKENKPTTHTSDLKPSACIESKMIPSPSQATEPLSNDSNTAPYYSRKYKKL